ncbi:MAG: sigma-54-dependent transcriptional regulator [bacterium]
MKILVIDDEKSMHVALIPFLGELGHEARSALTGSEGRRTAEDFKPDLILLDLYLPDVTGLELLKGFRARTPSMGVILMTAAAEVRTAVEAMKLGAEDYLQKPLSLDEMERVLNRYSKTRDLREEVTVLKDRLKEEFAREFLILPDPAMRQVYAQIQRVAEQDKVTALILGETGTGKEHVAKLLHTLSARSAKPFVELHCGALPETLMESELFGYEAGAFTDARKQKQGLFEAAQGGSLFLDEVGEMSLPTQSKLLKVLEDRKLRRLGGIQEIVLNVRVIAATHRDLEREVKAGRFRADLFYRLNVIPLKLPPLRQRPEDIEVLARFFWEEAVRDFDRKLEPLPALVLEKFKAYPWPGNARELKNVVNRIVIEVSGNRVGLGDLPDEIASYDPEEFPEKNEPEESLPLEKGITEKEVVERALHQSRWNKSKAAEVLGVTRKTLFNKMKKYDIH